MDAAPAVPAADPSPTPIAAVTMAAMTSSEIGQCRPEGAIGSSRGGAGGGGGHEGEAGDGGGAGGESTDA